MWQLFVWFSLKVGQQDIPKGHGTPCSWPVFLRERLKTVSRDEKSGAFRPCKQHVEPSNKNTIHFGIIYEKLRALTSKQEKQASRCQMVKNWIVQCKTMIDETTPTETVKCNIKTTEIDRNVSKPNKTTRNTPKSSKISKSVENQTKSCFFIKKRPIFFFFLQVFFLCVCVCFL